MNFPIHDSAASGFCRYCEYDDRVNLRYLRNTMNGKIIAVCAGCYEKRLLELALYFDDYSEAELVALETILDVMVS